MRIFKRIISIVIWAVIALNVILIGVSHLPAAQRYLGEKVAHAVGEALGTKVSVGRIDMGLLNRIIIDDIVILDQQQKQMLRASRLTAKIDLIPLAEGRISISSAQLFGTHARLYRQSATAKPNFQFVIDSLTSNDTTKTPLNLRINSLIIRHSSISYDQYDQPTTEGHFNPNHLKVSDISAHVNLKILTDDSLNVNVKRLGFQEQSGLKVNRLTFRLAAGRQCSTLQELSLQLPQSHLQIDTLTADYRLDEQGLTPGTLAFSGDIKELTITPSELSCFEPSLKDIRRSFTILTSFNGTDQQVTIPELRLSTPENDISLNISGWLENRNQQPAWHLQMNQVNLTEHSLEYLTTTFQQLPKELTRLGNIQLNGTFDKDLQGNINLKSLLHADAGDADLIFTMNAAQAFDGTLQTEGIDLKRLLDNEDMGQLATNLAVRGQLHEKEKPDVEVSGTISKLDFKDYSYNNISLDGQYRDGALAGNFAIDDPNAAMKLQGEVTDALFDESTKPKKITVRGIVSRFVPAALHLTDKWEDADFTANLDADFTGNTLNDAQGSIRLSRFGVSATEHHPVYQLDNLVLSSGYEDQIHYVTLKSDFADADLKGSFDYTTLAQSIANLVGDKLPTLPGLPSPTRNTDNNFSLRLMLSKTDWLKRFLGIDLTLRHPIMLNARVNDRMQDIFLDADMPSFAYNGAWYADGSLHLYSPSDTLKCDASISKLSDDGKHMNLNLLANAANNNLTASLVWDNQDTKARTSGELHTIMQLYRNLENLPEAHVRILPSRILLNNSLWDIEPSDIIYHKDRLLIDDFTVKHGKQHIIVDGIASKHKTDQLSVDLNQVEVGYILDLVDFHTVEFSGKATGKATATNLFDDFAASANLRVDEFKFEEGRMGVLDAKVDWNQEKEQIDIHAIANDGPDIRTLIDGYVSPTHNTIDLAIHADSTYVDFMHSFTSSFLSHITGHADGDVRLAGTLDNINLTGKLIVDGEATVSSLNTTYYMTRDTVVLIPDEIELGRLPLHDKEGHTAYLSGGIHHQHLTHLTFDLFVEADDLLAYDFPDFGDQLFYGTIYASGNVAIHGRPGEVTIDCDVTPQKNSFFVFNAANPDAISSQEFIQWEDGNTPREESAKPTEKPSSPVTPTTDIYLSFLVNTTPEATLRLLMDANTADYITLNGEGTIRATYHNKGAFNMFGTYTVDHGTYGVTIQNIIKKNFTFNRGGTIVFGGDPYQAALNLQAVYTVNGVSLSDLSIGNSFSSNTIRVNCLMNIGGLAASPQVDFDLEMPTVNADEQQMIRSVINGQQEMNQQVVFLLGIGRFYNQGANNANETQGDATSLAMQSFLSGTLSTQINTLLNQFIKNDNWNFGANISTGNEGWHNAEYEGIVNGRMMNNRLLINGQFGYRDNATQATPSFIGDFDIQYLLYPNGNLALKVYNQTNDRYFTKSSLNTQGLGIIMKKDFNGLPDLFSKKKKKNKKKKEEDAK